MLHGGLGHVGVEPVFRAHVKEAPGIPGGKGALVRAAAQHTVEHRRGLGAGQRRVGPEAAVVIALDPAAPYREGHGAVQGIVRVQIGKTRLRVRLLRPGKPSQQPHQFPTGHRLRGTESSALAVQQSAGGEGPHRLGVPGFVRYVGVIRAPCAPAPVRQELIQDRSALRAAQARVRAEAAVAVTMQIDRVVAAQRLSGLRRRGDRGQAQQQAKGQDQADSTV